MDHEITTLLARAGGDIAAWAHESERNRSNVRALPETSRLRRSVGDHSDSSASSVPSSSSEVPPEKAVQDVVKTAPSTEEGTMAVALPSDHAIWEAWIDPVVADERAFREWLVQQVLDAFSGKRLNNLAPIVDRPSRTSSLPSVPVNEPDLARRQTISKILQPSPSGDGGGQILSGTQSQAETGMSEVASGNSAIENPRASVRTTGGTPSSEDDAAQHSRTTSIRTTGTISGGPAPSDQGADGQPRGSEVDLFGSGGQVRSARHLDIVV